MTPTPRLVPDRPSVLVQTCPYVDRIVRIFRDRPYDDTTALVLIDFAQAAIAARDAAVPPGGREVDPILRGLREAIERIDPNEGRWQPCSGCYETEDGHPVGDYPHSPILGCVLGGGCHECGGLGAVWDTINYNDFAADPLQAATGGAVES